MKHALSMKFYYRELLSAWMQGAKQSLAIGFWHWVCEMITMQTKAWTWWDLTTELDSAELDAQQLRRGKATWASGAILGKRKLTLKTKGDLCHRERKEKEIAKVVQAQGNRSRRQGKAGKQSGDAGREINRLHLINSQAIHAGHDFSSSNQAETITLWMQTPQEEHWGAQRRSSVICMLVLTALL